MPDGAPTNGYSHDGSIGPKPSLIFFASARSGRSRRVEGYLAAVLQRRRNHSTFDVVHIDVEERPELAERYGITRVPALVVVESRRVKARLDEPHGAAEIKQLLAPWLQ